jgi:hypothetical protein
MMVSKLSVMKGQVAAWRTFGGIKARRGTERNSNVRPGVVAGDQPPEDAMANTDKKRADEKAVAGSNRDEARRQKDQAKDDARPTGDSPKRQGDPLRHLVEDKG